MPGARGHFRPRQEVVTTFELAGVDSLYGQLLRRMPPEEVGEPATRFAVVVPDSAETAALRVPKRVRDALRIDIYTVADDGQVEILSG